MAASGGKMLFGSFSSKEGNVGNASPSCASIRYQHARAAAVRKNEHSIAHTYFGTKESFLKVWRESKLSSRSFAAFSPLISGRSGHWSRPLPQCIRSVSWRTKVYGPRVRDFNKPSDIPEKNCFNQRQDYANGKWQNYDCLQPKSCRSLRVRAQEVAHE
jgi:hypothetical protein